MTKTMVPDWACIIADLASAGYSSVDVAGVIQRQVTHRTIRW